MFDRSKPEPRIWHLLIIDQDNVRRGLLSINLPEEKYHLQFASTEEQGLELLKRSNPEIVVVGHDSMPAYLCQHIRALPEAYSCMLILMDEGFTDEGTGEHEANEAGADTYLPFPFESSLLEQRVTEADDRFMHLRRPRRNPPPRLPAPTEEQFEPVVKKPAQDQVVRWEEFSKQIASIHGELDSLNYYRLLGVDEKAPGNEIKDAYFQCAMRYHPDRFMQLRNKQLQVQIYEVYKRLSEAFEVLINPVTRNYYDKQMEAIRSHPDQERNLRFLNFGRRARRQAEDLTREAHTADGKRYLHYARLAEAEGRYSSARNYMLQAIHKEPDNDELRKRLEDLNTKTALERNPDYHI